MTTTMSVRIDEKAKKGLIDVCNELGLTASAAINIFAKKVMREKRIPFDLALDDDVVYNEGNAKIIRKALNNVSSGKTRFHNIIEV